MRRFRRRGQGMGESPVWAFSSLPRSGPRNDPPQRLPANGLDMLTSMSDDEIHPNAPVALVTMEVRHPAMDALTESSSRELKRLLSEHLPIERQAQDMAWGMGPGGSPTPTADRFVRYVNRDNTIAASLKSEAITVETTSYTNFESFCEVVMRVVDARAQVSSIVGVERIGLRYVLEVRVPAGVDGRIDWANWISEPLLIRTTTCAGSRRPNRDRISSWISTASGLRPGARSPNTTGTCWLRLSRIFTNRHRRCFRRCSPAA